MSQAPKVRLELPLSRYLDGGESKLDDEQLWARVAARRTRHAPSVTSATLPLPLSKSLVAADELTVSRGSVFRRVRARVRRPHDRRLPRALLASAALGVAACLFIAFDGLRPAAPAALLRADGMPMVAVEAYAQRRRVPLADGSEILLEPGARIEPLLSSATRFELLLTRGSARFSVTPGGPRRWLVEAGAARVEVLGTVFRVTRSPAQVSVSVSRGRVRVTGERVPNLAQELTAGQQISVATRPAAPSAQPAGAGAEQKVQSDSPARLTASVAAPESHRGLPGRARRKHMETHEETHEETQTPVRLFERDTDPHAAYDSLGAAGMARATMQARSIEALLQLADIARLSGHPQDAVAPLTRALDGFRSSPQAGLAAFTLGRVLLEQLSAPAAAAEAFERAIALYLPRTLLSDCYRRLAEAYDRAGNVAARDAVSDRYRAAFPAETPSNDGAAR